MGIIPNNTGGFGDAVKAAEVFYQNEVVPLQRRFREVNYWVGEQVVTFQPYQLAAPRLIRSPLPPIGRRWAAFLRLMTDPDPARALVTPPRLPASWASNHASARSARMARRVGVVRRFLPGENLAESCS